MCFEVPSMPAMASLIAHEASRNVVGFLMKGMIIIREAKDVTITTAPDQARSSQIKPG